MAIPRRKLVVITGLSGSGKSSLAFDTLYADGQRRYVESLSSYARQFLGRMDKPDVDNISGISPAIAIEQKVKTRNPRSTVGTSTEVYEYLKLLFARIGKTYSPVSGRQVKRHRVSDVTAFILSLPENTDVLIYAPIKTENGRTLQQKLQVLLQQGFSRVMSRGKVQRMEEVLEKISGKTQPKDCFLVIDRIRVLHNESDLEARMADSVQTAFYEGDGYLKISYEKEGKQQTADFSH
ncbi:MAG TPA: excinuclease ABC subunit A, partial [Bacteroidetes bacterium]|nr:excinuclease ABC subunit A [Bacteroidota bacterium]